MRERRYIHTKIIPRKHKRLPQSFVYVEEKKRLGLHLRFHANLAARHVYPSPSAHYRKRKSTDRPPPHLLLSRTEFLSMREISKGSCVTTISEPICLPIRAHQRIVCCSRIEQAVQRSHGCLNKIFYLNTQDQNFKRNLEKIRSSV